MIKDFTNLILAFAEESRYKQLRDCLSNNTIMQEPYDQRSHIMITHLLQRVRITRKLKKCF